MVLHAAGTVNTHCECSTGMYCSFKGEKVCTGITWNKMCECHGSHSFVSLIKILLFFIKQWKCGTFLRHFLCIHYAAVMLVCSLLQSYLSGLMVLSELLPLPLPVNTTQVNTFLMCVCVQLKMQQFYFGSLIFCPVITKFNTYHNTYHYSYRSLVILYYYIGSHQGCFKQTAKYVVDQYSTVCCVSCLFSAFAAATIWIRCQELTPAAKIVASPPAAFPFSDQWPH